MAHIAFASCFVEVAEQLVTPTGGFFPMLTRITPLDFDPANPQAPRLDTFLQPNPNTGSLDSPTAAAFLESWEHLQGFVTDAYWTITDGPLEQPASRAGADRSANDRLQNIITAQIEQEQCDRLHRDLADLVAEDPRREAWFAVDSLSSQWVSAWPAPKHRLTAQEFPEVVSSYLGTMSPLSLIHISEPTRPY